MLKFRQPKGQRMIIILGMALGIWLGVRHAGRMGGQRLDKVQYGAVYGIIGGLLTLALSVAIEWSF